MLNTLTKKRKILVICDLILDEYYQSLPEGTILKQSMLGGGGNVCSQLLGMGHELYLISRLGNDTSARILYNLLSENIEKDNMRIFFSSNISTTTKSYFETEIINSLDDGGYISEFDNFILNSVVNLESKKFDCVIFSDYCKGVFDLNPQTLNTIKKIFLKRNVPIFVDSKRSSVNLFKDCTFFKSNMKEFCSQVGISIYEFSLDSVKSLAESYHFDYLVVTSDKTGVTAFLGEKFYQIESIVEEVVNEVGAGDTFLAYFACAYVANLDDLISLKLANAAAAVQVENKVTYKVSLEEVIKKYGNYY